MQALCHNGKTEKTVYFTTGTISQGGMPDGFCPIIGRRCLQIGQPPPRRPRALPPPPLLKTGPGKVVIFRANLVPEESVRPGRGWRNHWRPSLPQQLLPEIALSRPACKPSMKQRRCKPVQGGGSSSTDMERVRLHLNGTPDILKSTLTISGRQPGPDPAGRRPCRYPDHHALYPHQGVA